VQPSRRADDGRSDASVAIGPDPIEAVMEELPAAMKAISAAAFAVDGFDGAVADVTELLPVAGPRADAIVTRLAFLLEGDERLENHRREIRWLFKTRNRSVHGKVWKDKAIRHRSGVSVSAAQAKFCLESAERALAVSEAFVTECLTAAAANEDLAGWGNMRLARPRELLD
jgi:hypothetical protein